MLHTLSNILNLWRAARCNEPKSDLVRGLTPMRVRVNAPTIFACMHSARPVFVTVRCILIRVDNISVGECGEGVHQFKPHLNVAFMRSKLFEYSI